MKHFTIAAVLLAAVAPAAAAKEPQVTLSFATVAPDGSTWMEVLKEMDKEVREKTGSAVGFRYYAGGTMGEEDTVIDRMKRGALDGAGLTGTGLGRILPALRVLELPYMFRRYDEYDHVRNRLTSYFFKQLMAKGYLLLGWGEGGFSNFFSQKKIDTMEKLRASNVWFRGGDPFNKYALETIGVRPIPLSLADVMTGLQTSQIHTVYVSPLALVALQWTPYVKYRVDVPLFNILAAMVVRMESFNKIPAPQRVAFRRICWRRAKELTARTREDNRKALVILEQKNVETIALDDQRMREFTAKARLVGEGQAGKMYSKKLYRVVLSLLSQYRRALEKTSKAATPKAKG